MLIGILLMYIWLPAGWIQELGSDVVRKRATFRTPFRYQKVM